MPLDPVSELSRQILNLRSISALYQAERSGYTMLPLVDGYPISCLGNPKSDGDPAKEGRWQRWAYQLWHRYRQRVHGWEGMPNPPVSLEDNYERLQQLKQIARQEIQEAAKP
ncbi:MAG: hypothetical protein ACLQUY_11690 [Ktedonobacterales bacterium]